MISEAIILAGGLGTRLRSAVPNLPKCMAPVAGKPFIDYVLEYLATQNISHFILALGYQSTIIQQHVQQHFNCWHFSFSVEEEPLGTGGAITKACRLGKEKYTVVVNGDTLYKPDLSNADAMIRSKNAECLLYVKPMENIERYGVVDINENGQITAFREKQFYKKGLINGGLYIVDTFRFLQHPFLQKFSFEKDYLEAGVGRNQFYAVTDDAYFIDIGIPEDFEKANRELAHT